MKQNDFKAALDDLNKLTGKTFDDENHADHEFGQTLAYHIETICLVLKLADKVTGEPSDKMVLAAIDRNDTEEGMIYEGVFKAMIEQAQREVE